MVILTKFTQPNLMSIHWFIFVSLFNLLSVGDVHVCFFLLVSFRRGCIPLFGGNGMVAGPTDRNTHSRSLFLYLTDWRQSLASDMSGEVVQKRPYLTLLLTASKWNELQLILLLLRNTGNKWLLTLITFLTYLQTC